MEFRQCTLNQCAVYDERDLHLITVHLITGIFHNKMIECIELGKMLTKQ